MELHASGHFGKDKAKCSTPTLTEETLKAAFISAYSGFAADRETVIAGLVKVCVQENASKAQSQEEYERKYASLSARYEKVTEKLE